MLAPCEVAVKCVLPVVRAMVAKQLMTEHKLRQSDAAELLDVSQSAVSLYSRKMRGRAIDLETQEEIVAIINEMADSLADEIRYKEFVTRLCDVCRIVRGKGLMCKLHKSFDPNVDIEKCEICSVVTLKC